MKGLFILLVLIVAGIVGFGFYHGWFSLASESGDNKVHIQLTVDKDKIQADQQKTLDTVQGAGRDVKGKATTAIEKE
jgi:hypothetical protein